jgi:hypothetical protein
MIPYYTNQTGFFTASPPLEDLAYQNLKHWQADSDFTNYMRFAMIGAIAGSGIEKEEADKIGAYSVNAKFFFSNPDAKVWILEHEGKAAKIGQEYIKRIEERMEILGMQPLLQRTGNVTATGQYIDEAKIHCDIQAWIRMLEAHLLECYQMAADWVSRDLPEDFKIQIYDEFILPLNVINDMNILIKMAANGDLKTETLLKEAQRRGLLHEDFDPAEEVQGLKEEDPGKGVEDFEDEEEPAPQPVGATVN